MPTRRTPGPLASYDLTSSMAGCDGRSVLFDISGDNSRPIALRGELRPKAVWLMNSKGHDYPLPADRALAVGEEVRLFTAPVISGTFTVDGNGCEWDATQLLSEGTLRVVARSSAVDAVELDPDQRVEVFTLSGIRLMHDKSWSEARQSLRPDYYIVNGVKRFVAGQ